MPIIREELPPERKGTKGRILNDLKKMSAGQSIEYNYDEFYFQTELRFRRTVEGYMYLFRKEEDLDLYVTWIKTGFKIYKR